MRPKPATKRASRGAILQKEKSASSKLIACSGNLAATVAFKCGSSPGKLGGVAADRDAHQRERIGAAVVGFGDRKRDARVLHHVLRVPGEAADMHVEGAESLRRRGTASSKPSARRRAAWRGARCARCAAACQAAAVSASMQSIVVFSPRSCVTSSWSACATHAPSAATASSASSPLISMVGIALGVAALIVVLSVMNGFQKEVRDAHPRRRFARRSSPGRAARSPTGRRSRRSATRASAGGRGRAVRAGAGHADLATDSARGVAVRGMLPEARRQGRRLRAAHGERAASTRCSRASFGIVLGADLARALGVAAGRQGDADRAAGQVTPAGVVPRLKQFTVVGIFEVGLNEYDAGLALIHLEDAQRSTSWKARSPACA